MATKSGQQEPAKAEVVEELLDALDTSLDRVKVLYEQYFLGIQKQPPTFLHTDIERKIRDLAQLQIRNTALRYRYATLGQKFGSYNSYWRRTLRQIEQGTYTRNLSKIGRQAARTGDDVPEEILAAMPKRMREQVKRDRVAALANARRRDKPVTDGSELLTLADEDVEIDVDELEPAAFIAESTAVRRNLLTAGGAHRIADDDEEFDVDAFFAKVTSEGDPNPVPVGVPRPEPRPAAPAARKRTGSSGHPRPAARSGSATAAIPGGARLPTVAPASSRPSAPPGAAVKPPSVAPASAKLPQPASAKPPLPSLMAAAAKRPGVAQASVMPQGAASVKPQAAASVKPQAAASVGPPVAARSSSAPDVAAPAEDAAQTSVTSVQPTPLSAARLTQALPRMPMQGSPQPIKPAVVATQPSKPPVVATQAIKLPMFAAASIKPPVLAPSQATRPLPVSPGAAAARAAAQVETMAGPFPRIPSLPPVPMPPRAPSSSLPPAESVPPASATGAVRSERPPVPMPARAVPVPLERPTPAPAPERAAAPERSTPPPAPERAAVPARPTPPPAPERAAAPERPASPPKPRPPSERPVPAPRQAPPPGMTDADVNALYAKYVKAKEVLGEQVGPGAYGKLLKTINAQAPKIMEQYKSTGVDFSVIVKDNQVIIRAKPKP